MPKAGQLNVAIQDEEIIWYDRKRWAFLGLPWTFTKYTLTSSKLSIKTGFLSQKTDEIRLYRITDISMKRSLIERINGTGTLCLLSSDSSMPDCDLIHIKHPEKVKNIISQCVEISRNENGVRTSELVGGSAGGHYPGDGHHHASMGPEMVPDMNHDGIDDRTQV